MSIKMYERKIGDLGELLRKRGFSSTWATDDQDAFHFLSPFEALPAPLVGTTAIGQFNLQRVLAAFARQKQRSVLCQVGAGFDAERKHSGLISSPDSKLVQLVASERQADGYVEFTVADNDRIRFRNL